MTAIFFCQAFFALWFIFGTNFGAFRIFIAAFFCTELPKNSVNISKRAIFLRSDFFASSICFIGGSFVGRVSPNAEVSQYSANMSIGFDYIEACIAQILTRQGSAYVFELIFTFGVGKLASKLPRGMFFAIFGEVFVDAHPVFVLN